MLTWLKRWFAPAVKVHTNLGGDLYSRLVRNGDDWRYEPAENWPWYRLRWQDSDIVVWYEDRFHMNGVGVWDSSTQYAPVLSDYDEERLMDVLPPLYRRKAAAWRAAELKKVAEKLSVGCHSNQR